MLPAVIVSRSASMKISAITIVLGLWMSSGLQTGSFEKLALALVQRLPVARLDAELPGQPFGIWFRELVGPQAGVVWQLTECGARTEQDLPACVEANASLPDGRKVIVLLAVGSFKQGLASELTFYRAVIEQDEQLYAIERLRNLPLLLRAPENLPRILPTVSTNQPLVKPMSLRAEINFQPPLSRAESEAPPPAPPPAKPPPPPRISEGVLRGNAVTRSKPLYPPSAARMNAAGPVEVQVTISEDGRVVEAKAISGHLALRNAAVEAARKWVFHPTTLNGVPLRVQSILTFVFTPGDQ